MIDEDHMRAALSLAARGLGQTAPNPSVGCVIVGADGSVVGRGTTAPGGRPHAEVVALRMAGDAARGGTAYVTLEPCSHVGQTPPCADALIAAGIARVVVATTDPDPRVNGSGLARLRAAGVAVTEGVLTAPAETLGAGFTTRVRLGRPLVTLKLASTLDGRIATARGESRWITGPAARRAAHFLRATHDAILVGVGTVLADDPDLTCRLPGARAVPLRRVVADSTLRTPPTARLVTTAAETPTLFLTRPDADPARQAALIAAGARVLPVAAYDGGIDLAAGLAALGADGLTQLLVEGGGGIAASLLRAGLVDRLAWFHAPAIMGGDGWPAAAPLGLAGLADIPRFVRTCVRPVGDDLLTMFHRE
jgi:diaminohydroxyphosphoribosylaminopyrimidine deaminase/5-amino-6-(5-phosphoribosylamino)uracil reductase